MMELNDAIVKVKQLNKMLEQLSQDPIHEEIDSGNNSDDFVALRKMVEDASLRIDAECNKVAVGWPSMTTVEEKSSLLKELIAALEIMVTSAYICVSNDSVCCREAQDQLNQTVLQVCISMETFLCGLDSETPETCAIHVGEVWATSQKVRQVAKTNRAACKRRVLMQNITMKDIIREFTEILENPTETGEDAPVLETEAAPGSEEWYAMMDGLMEGEVDADDAETISGFLGQVNNIITLAQTTLECILTVEEPKERNARREYIKWLNDVMDALVGVENQVKEIAYVMYPPIDPDQVDEREALLAERIAKLRAILLVK